MTIEINVDAAGLKKQLDTLSKEFRTKTISAATRAAALVFKKATIQYAPRLAFGTKSRNSGTLQKAIYLKRSSRSTSGAERFYIGVRAGRKYRKKSRDAFYWYFLEHGWIPRGPGKKLRGGERYRSYQRADLLFYGAKQIKYPFLQKAFDIKKGEATVKFNAVIAKYIAKANLKRGVL